MAVMENLRRMAVYAAVVDAGSFTAAAGKLGLTRSAVSRQIALLEDHLGVRLLNRTTRRLHLTEAGERYYDACARIVAVADEAHAAARSLHSTPRGRIRVSAPVISHGLLMPLLQQYLQRYPEISLDLTLEDQYVNLVQEGVDLALRIGHPTDSSLIARKLAQVDQVICGSPAYLERQGTPRQPQDLISHQWISYSLLASPGRLVLTRGRSRQTVRVAGQLQVNGGPAMRDALLAGMGLTQIPRFYVGRDLRDGDLTEVLAEFSGKRSQLYAVYPHREHLPLKVRLLVDLLSQQLGQLPRH